MSQGRRIDSLDSVTGIAAGEPAATSQHYKVGFLVEVENFTDGVDTFTVRMEASKDGEVWAPHVKDITGDQMFIITEEEVEDIGNTGVYAAYMPNSDDIPVEFLRLSVTEYSGEAEISGYIYVSAGNAGKKFHRRTDLPQGELGR